MKFDFKNMFSKKKKVEENAENIDDSAEDLDSNEISNESGMESATKGSKLFDPEKAKRNKKLISLSAVAVVAVLGVYMGQDYISKFLSNDQEYMESEKFERSAPLDTNKFISKNMTGDDLAMDEDGVYRSSKEIQANKRRKKELADANLIQKSEEQATNKRLEAEKKFAVDVDKINKGLKEAEKVISVNEATNDRSRLDEVQKALISDLGIDRQDNSRDIDPFLQSYLTTLDNNKKLEELDSNVRLMEGATRFLQAKVNYDAQIDAFEKRLTERSSKREINKVKAEMNAELEAVKRTLDDIRRQNSELKDKLSQAEKVSEVETRGGISIEGRNRLRIDGIQQIGDGKFIASKIYGNNEITQNIYRLGSNFILEEVDEAGNTNIYRKGSTWRGTRIKDIAADLIVVTSDGTDYVVSIGQSTSGSGDYNFITVNMPTKSSIKNSIEEDRSRKDKPRVRNYDDVKRERAREQEAAEYKFFN